MLSKPWHFRVTTGNHPQLIPSEKRWVGLQCFRGGIPAGEIQYRIIEDRRIGLSKIYPASSRFIAALRFGAASLVALGTALSAA